MINLQKLGHNILLDFESVCMNVCVCVRAHVHACMCALSKLEGLRVCESNICRDLSLLHQETPEYG